MYFSQFIDREDYLLRLRQPWEDASFFLLDLKSDGVHSPQCRYYLFSSIDSSKQRFENRPNCAFLTRKCH